MWETLHKLTTNLTNDVAANYLLEKCHRSKLSLKEYHQTQQHYLRMLVPSLLLIWLSSLVMAMLSVHDPILLIRLFVWISVLSSSIGVCHVQWSQAVVVCSFLCLGLQLLLPHVCIVTSKDQQLFMTEQWKSEVYRRKWNHHQTRHMLRWQTFVK